MTVVPVPVRWADAARAPSPDALLAVEDLTITVPSASGPAEAVRHVSFSIGRGEIVGLVGESGSGKTLTCRSILGVLPPRCEVVGGRVLFDGLDLTTLGRREWERVHGADIGGIFQDPASYLDPAMPVGRQLVELLRTKTELSRAQARERSVELLGLMGLYQPHLVYGQLPRELSGGMLQRVMIAMAVACDPKLVIADEATTALDVVTQAGVVRLLQGLRRTLGISVLFVSHDLDIVSELCDRIIVFYGGEVVEVAGRQGLVGRPRHPYTDALFRVAGTSFDRSRPTEIISGQPPAVGEDMAGCRFAPRCPFAIEECRRVPVALAAVGEGRVVRCLRADELSLTGGLGDG